MIVTCAAGGQPTALYYLDARHRNEARNLLHSFDPCEDVRIRLQVDAALARERGIGEARNVTDSRVTEFQPFAVGQMVIKNLEDAVGASL